MKEKRKNSPRTYWRFAKICVKIAAVFVVSVSVIAFLVWSWLFGGSVKSSLDAEYISEAQYLYENPKNGLIKSPYSENEWIYLNFQMTDRDMDDNKLCFGFSFLSDMDQNNLRWAELSINKQVVRRSLEDWRSNGVVLSMPASTGGCVTGNLNTGYHLIEFRLKGSAFSEPYYIRKMAILVQ